MRRSCLFISRTLNLLLATTLACFAATWFQAGKLPEERNIRPEVLEDPTQVGVRQEAFVHEYRGKRFVVEPVAEYKISGVIVSHNNISAFDDIYHDDDSVDVKDLCVVWGENVSNGVFRRIEYWSEPWTCNARWEEQEISDLFSMSELSNNHLLSDDKRVLEAIKQARIGDQISMRGLLVNYYPEGQPDYIRKSSTIRGDTGNGACEVMFVDEFDFLRREAPTLHRLHDASKQTALVLLVLRIAAFLVLPYLEYRWG